MSRNILYNSTGDMLLSYVGPQCLQLFMYIIILYVYPLGKALWETADLLTLRPPFWPCDAGWPSPGREAGCCTKAFCFSPEFCLSFQLLISAWFTGLGGLLRNISTLGFVPRHHSYAVLLTGQILAACAQPFVLFAPTKLAAVWFQENRRATTNMVGSMSK